MSETTTTTTKAHMTTLASRHSNVIKDLLKRTFDLLVATVSVLLLAPIFALVAWRIRRDSPGPVFYRGPRVGRGGEIFQIIKFRTMYERPESYVGPNITAGDDPRITPLGKWLRNTKLNELPQLWNVLKGEMSLVGPRPEYPEIVAAWPTEARIEILSVRPGVTSPASILYRDEESLLQGSRLMTTYLDQIQPSKLRLDQLYVRYRSFWGDLDIIFWTLLVLILQARSFAPPEGRLLWGPIARFMRRHVSWFVIDLLVTYAAIGLAGLIWRSFGPLDVGWGPSALFALGFALLYSLTNVILGVNRIRWAKAPAIETLDLLPGVALATTIAVLANHYFPIGIMTPFYGGSPPTWLALPIFPTGMVLVAAAFASFGFVLVRYRSRLVTGLASRWVNWRGLRAARERVLIVGGGETGQYAAWMINNGRYAESLHVIGFVDDDLYKQDARIHGVDVLGDRAEISRLVAEHDIGIILFAIHNISPGERHELLEICKSTPAQLMLFPDIPAALNGMARHGRQDHGTTNTAPTGPQDSTSQWLPCFLCLTKAFPPRVDDWLDSLEAQARNGDLDGILAHVQELRQKVREEAGLQRAAGYPNDGFGECSDNVSQPGDTSQ